MKLRLFVFLLVPIVLSSAISLTLRSGTDSAYPFRPDETLTFRMKWKPSFFIPTMEAGDITIRFAGRTTFSGRPALLLETRAVSTPGFRVSVRDFFYSYSDPLTFQAIHTKALLHQDDEKREQFIFFYPDSGHLWLKEYRQDLKKGTPPEVSRNQLHWNVPEPLQDVATLIYAIRSRLNTTPPPFSLQAAYGARIKQVFVYREEKTDTLDTIFGSIEVDRFNIRNLFGDMMDEDDYFYVWTTRDSRHIPVRVKAKVKYGHIEGDLTGYSFRKDSLVPANLHWINPVPDRVPDISAKIRPISTPPPSPPGEDIIVPGGSFVFGSGSGEEGIPVQVDSFRIDRYEVTNRQYLKFVRATGHRIPDVMPFSYYEHKFKWKRDGYEEYLRLAEPFRWKNGTYPPGRGDYPVVLVSWDDARAYARWAGKRLPTEAEWEMAARAGRSNVDFPWGNQVDITRADTIESDHLGLLPVGYLKRGVNPLGLYDLCGNASEWVTDWYDDHPFRSGSHNPQGPSHGRYKVFRGGDWRHTLEESTVWYRGRDWPEMTYVNVGFRCARDVH